MGRGRVVSSAAYVQNREPKAVCYLSERRFKYPVRKYVYPGQDMIQAICFLVSWSYLYRI